MEMTEKQKREAIAQRAGVTPNYVWMVLTGRRGAAQTAKQNMVLDLLPEYGLTVKKHDATTDGVQ